MRQLDVVRIIGDVHGQHGRYVELIKKPKYSVQLGDMNFNYSQFVHIDPTKHVFIPGNHDNYEALPCHALPGDFGTYSVAELNFDFFYIRGAYSVDKKWRTQGLTWWPQEEISWASCNKLINTVKELQPRVILSHDCPSVCHEYGVVTNDLKLGCSKTTAVMDAVWDECAPSLWLFGHHHNDWERTLDGTRFICLNELSFVDIHPDGSITR